MSTTRARRWVLAAVAALALSGCSGLITIDLSPRIRPLEEETVEGSGKAKILLLDLSGVLQEEVTSFSLTTPPPRVPLLARVREELKKAEKDDDVAALVVRINSPGGTITASDILYREIRGFKERKKVPVIAAIMDVGASGGYYAALAADQILAHPTTVTGSIGVIMLTLNAQGLLEKIGVAPLAIKSGEKKDAGSPFRAMTADERALFQGIIDDMHGRFVRLLAESRRLPEAQVRGFADGRVYTAEQALALKLVDRIGYLDDALAMARRAARIDAARVIMYHRPREYRATYYATAPGVPADASLGQLGAQLASMLGGPGPRFYYLWWP
jgi:protease-4